MAVAISSCVLAAGSSFSLWLSFYLSSLRVDMTCKHCGEKIKRNHEDRGLWIHEFTLNTGCYDQDEEPTKAEPRSRRRAKASGDTWKN